MPPKATWVRLTADQQEGLTNLSQAPGWRIVPTKELAPVLPPGLVPKLDAVMVVADRTSTGGVYLMLNTLRVDGEELDQQPFGVIVSSTGASSSGVWVDHGRWEGRTVDLPDDFLDTVDNSTIGSYYCAKPPSGMREGGLEQLSGGHREALEKITGLLRERKDSKRTA
jgi:hypothetical protein